MLINLIKKGGKINKQNISKVKTIQANVDILQLQFKFNQCISASALFRIIHKLSTKYCKLIYKVEMRNT